MQTVAELSYARPMPRVMHVLTSLEIGGAEMLVLQLLTRLPGAASHARVVTLRRRGPLAERIEALGIPVDSLEVPVERGVFALATALARVVRRERPDIIHSHNSSPLVAAALATLLAPRTRLIHTEHGRSSTGSWTARTALRLASRRTAIIVAVSNDTAAWARRNGGMPHDRLRVIRNGVAVEPDSPWRPEGRHHAVTVARLEKVKDLATMIRAVADVAKRLPDFHLHIFGDGAERSNLVGLTAALGLETRISFHGVTHEVASALARGDVFLSSSVSEGISLTVLEAMATGLPIVATAVGGTPELVEDGRNGRLVPPQRPDLLATAVVDVLADPARAAALGQASRERARTEFSLDVMVADYRRLYETV